MTVTVLPEFHAAFLDSWVLKQAKEYTGKCFERTPDPYGCVVYKIAQYCFGWTFMPGHQMRDLVVR